MKQKVILSIIVVFVILKLAAHPMPHSVLKLDVKDNSISSILSLPLKEFQYVFPNEDLDNGYKTLVQRKGQWLNDYLLQHIFITDPEGLHWKISIVRKWVDENEQPLTGKYHELSFELKMQPPENSSVRHFVIHYDVIMHQLVTHKLFIRINSDWYGGMTSKDSLDADLGVLMVNPADGKIPPVVVNLDEGNTWKGFTTMVQLGINHIAEGTDHLLFLFMLLLPATLLSQKRKWTRFGGTKYSLIRLVKLATAFTIGHSFSLLLGAMKWVTLPQQPVEIAIAITILITAIHAIRPIFYRKEIFIATGFGLIHGLAFSGVLSEMNLDGSRLAWSILGFNLGIEAMQLFVILCTVPWLIILSKKNIYHLLRLSGACLGIVAAIGWMIERITLQSNMVSFYAEKLAVYGKYILAGIALLAIMLMIKNNLDQRRNDDH